MRNRFVNPLTAIVRAEGMKMAIFVWSLTFVTAILLLFCIAMSSWLATITTAPVLLLEIKFFFLDYAIVSISKQREK